MRIWPMRLRQDCRPLGDWLQTALRLPKRPCLLLVLRVRCQNQLRQLEIFSDGEGVEIDL